MLSDKELALLNKIQKKAVYEDKFFEKRTELKWFDELKKRGYFKPNPDTLPQESKEKGYYSIPQWNVLPYLESVSQQVSTPENEKYIDVLLEIIKNVSTYRDYSGQHIDNYRTWFYFVKILCNIPNGKIPMDIINLIPIWLDSKFNTILQGAEIATKLLPKFLTGNPEDIKKAEKIIDYITEIKWIKLPEKSRRGIFGKEEEPQTFLDTYWLFESFVNQKNAIKVGEQCSAKLISLIANRLKEIFSRLHPEQEGIFNDSSYIWFRAIAVGPEFIVYGAKETFTFILRDILLAKAKKDKSDAQDILREFLTDKYQYPLFKRIALFVINKCWDDFYREFWNIVNADKGERLFDDRNYEAEIYTLLEGNIARFTLQEKERLKEIIEKGPQKYLPEDNREIYINLWKQKWYSTVKTDPYFALLYKELKEFTKIEEEFSFKSPEVQIGPGPSPLSKEYILDIPNKELADFLKIFKTKDPRKGPTIEGLAELLKVTVQERPEKFINDLSLFLNTGNYYIYKMLSGIKDAWDEKKMIDWGKGFKFIENYISQKDFWEDKLIVEKDRLIGSANRQWVAGIVADLIQDGTRDDAWAFSEQYFEKAEEIIFLLLDSLRTEEDREITDYVTYTLNTALGRTITALVLLALRIARVNDKKGIKSDIKWKPEFKKKYEEILNNKTMEGFVNLGYYLPNFYYLDKEWVKEKVKALEKEKNNKSWEAFMNGYLSIGRVYDDLYILMRPYYQYSIKHKFKEKHDNEHLIQHIALAYLRGYESLDKSESLFKQILDKFEYDQINEIIGFFWMQRDYLKEDTEENEKIRVRIIEFWKRLNEKYQDINEASLKKQDKQILSAVSKLATFLPKIDSESYKWLMLSAPYTHEDFNSPFFIEYLDKLKDKGDKSETAKYIGDVYLKMLDKFTPDYDQKHIRSIVEFFYDAGKTDSANKICNTYGARGVAFLRDIYDNHANKT